MPAVLSVLFARRIFPVAASSLIARLPKGMTPLAAVTLVHQTTGSYAYAGIIAAALALGDALTTPVQGRLLDRYGRARVLLPSAAIYATALTLLAVLAIDGRPMPVLTGCALAAGAGFPPISGSMKALWPHLAEGTGPTVIAYAAESLIQQTLLLIAPLLATALIVWASPAAALWAAATATLAGTAGFVCFAAAIGTTAPNRLDGASVLRLPAFRMIVTSAASQGIAFGALPVILPALAVRSGVPAAGGLLLAVWICGGIGGSFRQTSRGYQSQLARLSLALMIPAAAAILGGSTLAPVAIGLGVAGLFLTPVAAASYVLIEAAIPPANRTEAFTWQSTAFALGGAAGSAVAGTTIEQLGAALALLLPVAATAMATALARRT